MMGNLNKLLTFHKGYITTITGLPGSGKSDFVDQVTLQLAINADWKGAYYSPENKPTSLHISKLARKIIGKSWWGDGRISKDEINLAKDFLNDRIFWIKPENDFTLDTILKHVKQLVLRKGIDFFVIDAFNKLEHKYEQNETKYIGECLDKMAVFCEDTKTHLFLVAHPTKTPKQKNSNKFEVPNLYSISGSANFFNKTDNGICVYRDYEEEVTKIYVQKVKFSFWGEVGHCEFKYDLSSGRYNEYNGGALINMDKTAWIYGAKGIPAEITNSVKSQGKEDKGIVDFDGEVPF
jgi:twinkle protein